MKKDIQNSAFFDFVAQLIQQIVMIYIIVFLNTMIIFISFFL